MMLRLSIACAITLLSSLTLLAQPSISLKGFRLGMSSDEAKALVTNGGWRSVDGGDIVFPAAMATADLAIEPTTDSSAILHCADGGYCARLATLDLSFSEGRLSSLTVTPESAPLESTGSLVAFVRTMIASLTESHGAPTRAPADDVEKALSTMTIRTKYAPLVLAIWSFTDDGREVASITVQARAFKQGASTIAQASVQLRGR